MNKLKVLSILGVILIVFVIGLITYNTQNRTYDIDEVQAILQVDSVSNYTYANANGLPIVKFYYKGKEIDRTKKKGFSVGYSLNKKESKLTIYLMQKGKSKKIEFNLEPMEEV